MKKNKWLLNLVYAVILFGYAFVAFKVLDMLSEYANLYYVIFPQLVVSLIIYIIFGLLLGSTKLISEIKKAGNWKINLPRLIILGVPSLYLSIQMVISFLVPIPLIFSTGLPLFQIIFGFVVITSFEKVKKSDINSFLI